MATKIRSLFTRQSLYYIDSNRNVQARITSLQRMLHSYAEVYRQNHSPEVLEIICVYSAEILRLKQKYSNIY